MIVNWIAGLIRLGLTAWPQRPAWWIWTAFVSVTGVDPVTLQRIHPRHDLRRFGSRYGGWIVPTSLIDSNSICYSAGVGEDISFELGLIDRFKCEVVAIDPTPRSRQHVDQVSPEIMADHFRFVEVGLWSTEGTQRFYAPADPQHVSHSVVNLQKTSSFFEAECTTVASLMQHMGHEKLDVLKLDIEGAEYEVVRNLVEDSIPCAVLCLE